MTPAELVISRFGGVRPLSRLLNRHHSSIVRWPQPKPRGLGGFIPSNLHQTLLAIAKQRGIKLTSHELIYGGSDDDKQCAK